MVADLGGPADFITNYDNYLEKAEIVKLVYALKACQYQRWIRVQLVWLSLVWAVNRRGSNEPSIDSMIGFDKLHSLAK
ncbi:hypothetical protein O9929_08305 [Vibrio lentus]|nr:hypothetical protein [Vibrio lentus]